MLSTLCSHGRTAFKGSHAIDKWYYRTQEDRQASDHKETKQLTKSISCFIRPVRATSIPCTKPASESSRVEFHPRQGSIYTLVEFAQHCMYDQIISTSGIFPGPSSQDSVHAWAGFKANQGRAFQ